jgi:integrase
MTDKGLAGKTIKNKHAFLSGALNVAVRAGRIAANPAAGARLPTTEREDMVFLTRDEFQQLLAATPERWQPMLEFLVASGCRYSEAAALKPSDVNRTKNTVRIQRSWHRTYIKGSFYELGPPKTRKSIRTINVPKTVVDKLDYTGEWLFTAPAHGTRYPAGRPVHVDHFRRAAWVPALAKAKLEKKPRIHDLRHTCASWLIQAGVPLPVVQAQLGHESINTTIGLYTHLDRRSHEAAAEAMHRALLNPDG